MEKIVLKPIEEIIGEMKCPKDFKCYKSGFKNLCKADDIGLKSLIVCLEEKPYECNFSRLFGDSYFCECPLRKYIVKELEM
jgi:hypothetical protein